MKNESTIFSESINSPGECEQAISSILNFVRVYDLYAELYKEKVEMRDLTVSENPANYHDYLITEKELEHIKNKVLSPVSKILTPMQLIALNYYSCYEAEFTIRPKERKRIILKEMSKSKKLKSFEIDDLTDFTCKLKKIDPSVF